MADTDVSTEDVALAAKFLQQFMSEVIPDGDFTEGSPNHDFLIRGFGYMFAYMRKKISAVRDRGSLLTLRNLPDDESLADATDAILANLFCERRAGRFARGTLLLVFVQRTTVLVPRRVRFFKTSAHVFYLDLDSDLLINPEQLVPQRDSTGRTVGYSATIQVKAARIGGEFNFPPGPFSGYDQFSASLRRVENLTPITGGLDEDTNGNFIDTAATSLSFRSLCNARSNRATLLNAYPGSVSEVATVGFGDPEMVRDLAGEPGTQLGSVHVGGHMDVFLRMEVREVTKEGVIGANYVRADGKAVVLRDVEAPPARNFLTGAGLSSGKPVVPGDVLTVSVGLPGAVREYVIRGVAAHELTVSERTPFPVATDEIGESRPLTLGIGSDHPAFTDKHFVSTSANFVTSRQFSRTHTIVLDGGPVYRVAKVEVFDADPALDAYKDPETGNLLFTDRVNALPSSPIPEGSILPFKVTVLNPRDNQSNRAITLVELGWPSMNLDDLGCVVTYETVSGFTEVHNFVANSDNRNGNSNALARAQHPVYVSAVIPYRASVVVDPFQGNTLAVFNEEVASADVAEKINDYRQADVLDVNFLANTAKAATPGAGATFPFVAEYELLSPDGRVLRYSTTDVLTLFPDGANGAQLLNPADFSLPMTGYASALRFLLRQMGISDRTVRYRAQASDILFEKRG